jgi:hypothetical protein
VSLWLKQDINRLHGLLRLSEAPHFACGVYLCVVYDCGDLLCFHETNCPGTETRCEVKVVTMVTVNAPAFCMWVEICCSVGGTDVGSTFLRYVGEFLPDYTVSHPRTDYS